MVKYPFAPKLGVAPMFVIVELSGKQYRLEEGKVFRTSRLTGNEGDSLEFDKVLLASDVSGPKIGRPYLTGAKVTCEIISQKKGPKIKVFKFKRVKRQKKMMGYRDQLTYLKVKDITLS